MYVNSRPRHRSTLGELGEGGKVAAGAASGAAAGAAAGPWGAAIGAIIGAAVSMAGGKVHQSPWGFLYDDYPMKIYEAELIIRQVNGQPLPPPAARTGGEQYQKSMQDIVPKYVPGSEQQIAAYDRRLNEPGGAYEVTYGKQLEMLRQIQAGFYASPQTVSPNVPPQLPTAARPAGGFSIPKLTGVTPEQYFQPQVMPSQQAGMFDLNAMSPWLLGGVALLLVIAFASDKAASPAPAPIVPPVKKGK